MIRIDYEKCDNCDLCWRACLAMVIDRGPEVRPEGDTLCIECGHCYAVCPREAITVLGYEEVETRPVERERPVAREDMMRLLRGRRSARGFRKGAQVPEEELRALIEAASVAPSAHNSRPLKAYVFRDPHTIEKMRRRTLAYYRRMARIFNTRLFAAAWKLMLLDPEEHRILSGAFMMVTDPRRDRDVLFYDAPCLLVITAPRFNSMAQGDAWLASENAVLYAESAGLGTCFNGFLIMAANWDLRLRRIMRIPWRERVVGALMVGYASRDWKREAPRKTIPAVWV